MMPYETYDATYTQKRLIITNSDEHL